MTQVKNNTRTKVPVLLVIFNRPDVTERTFRAIREYRPEKLYVAADGPRQGIEGEHELCERTRNAVISQLDWECDVKTLFRPENIGCGRGVSGAISWMLEQEEYGIILEDDCLPCPEFFKFCEVLLPRYKDDERIAQINGFDPDYSGKESDSYFFTSYVSIWGWATWARSWENYDYELKSFPSVLRVRLIFKKFPIIEALFRYFIWQSIFKRIKYHKYWDIQWSIHVFMNNKICINPFSNLVINTGFGENATMCTNPNDPKKNVIYGTLKFPLVHPKGIYAEPDRERRKSQLWVETRIHGLKRKIGRLFHVIG